MEEESKGSYHNYKPPRSYLERLKRHQDAILALHSPHGIEGTELVSGSADERLRIWDMKERKVSKQIEVIRPTNEMLIKYKNLDRDSLPIFSDMVKLEQRAIASD